MTKAEQAAARASAESALEKSRKAAAEAFAKMKAARAKAAKHAD